MSTAYEILDFDQELEVLVVRKETLLRRALSGPVLATLSALFVGYYYSPRAWLPGVGLLGLAAGSLAMFRGKKASLKATSLEFHSRGRFRGEPRSERVVCTADIRWLEYQSENEGGSDFIHNPGGLYAAISRGTVCLLPYVDEKQTQEIIIALEKKFPALSEQWRKHSPYGSSFISLNAEPT